ncbi:MAG: helix-turn-helix domain-containing protein [Tannerellaceae bacterium]|nr:helix-turn-helix domain-containing protein [Tannerellaceae bacterium]
MEKVEEKEQRKNECLVELGRQIQEIRNSKGMTQGDLTEVDTSHLSDIETGKSDTTFLTLIKIAKHLDCDIAAFSKNIPK